MPDCRAYQPGRLNGFPVDAVHWLATYGRDEMGQPMPSQHGIVRCAETRTSTTFYWAERDPGDYEGSHRLGDDWRPENSFTWPIDRMFWHPDAADFVCVARDGWSQVLRMMSRESVGT